MSEQNKTEIKRIYFCIHPVAWSAAYEGYNGVPPGYDPLRFMKFLEWEKRVIPKMHEFIENLKDNDALIVYPCGTNDPTMEALEAHAEKCLGKRCVILRPEFRARDLPNSVKVELFDEILDTVDSEGWYWNTGGIKVIVGNRRYSIEIKKEFCERGLVYDPASVECEAFGEGFEQCAMTWKSIIPHYLGLAKPIENNFDLSVSGAHILADARFVERVALAGDVRLFLWESADGDPIGLYVKAATRLSDKQLYARIPLDSFPVELHTIGFDKLDKLWPASDRSDSLVQPEASHLRITILTGLRKKRVNECVYIIGQQHITMAAFRDRLIKAEIVT